MPKVPNRDEVADMTFDEIAKKYGEETAIEVGIAADPDTFELDAEWFAKARPVSNTRYSRGVSPHPG